MHATTPTMQHSATTTATLRPAAAPADMASSSSAASAAASRAVLADDDEDGSALLPPLLPPLLLLTLTMADTSDASTTCTADWLVVKRPCCACVTSHALSRLAELSTVVESDELEAALLLLSALVVLGMSADTSMPTSCAMLASSTTVACSGCACVDEADSCCSRRRRLLCARPVLLVAALPAVSVTVTDPASATRQPCSCTTCTYCTTRSLCVAFSCSPAARLLTTSEVKPSWKPDGTCVMEANCRNSCEEPTSNDDSQSSYDGYLELGHHCSATYRGQGGDQADEEDEDGEAEASTEDDTEDDALDEDHDDDDDREGKEEEESAGKGDDARRAAELDDDGDGDGDGDEARAEEGEGDDSSTEDGTEEDEESEEGSAEDDEE